MQKAQMTKFQHSSVLAVQRPAQVSVLKLFGFMAAASFMVSAFSPAFADQATAEYKLGPLDKVRLRVQEWRASKDEVYQYTALNEQYIVGPSGTLAVPLVGDVTAAGLTTTQLEKVIGDRLKQRLGMIESPDTAVEIVQYRPFYIIGQVDKPGEYPFRPGLTILQAMSVAGGMQRVNDMGLFRLERDSITSRGELGLISLQTYGMLARKCRLEAELKSATEITFGKALLDRESDPAIKTLLDQERLLFETRRKGLETQISALEQLKAYLNKEVESLVAQVETENTQMKLVNKELDSVSSLVERGLSAAPRQLLLQRTIAQIEGERLRLKTGAVKAQQDISKTDIAILDVRNKWINDITVELRATQATLEDLAQKKRTSSKLAYEAEVTAPQFISERMRSNRMQPSLKIVRKVNGLPIEMDATETTAVMPGDTVKVQLPTPDTSPISQSSIDTSQNSIPTVPSTQ
jgi:polysaccharide export outer membrane protein/exopolysaccharide production protein ExoF